MNKSSIFIPATKKVSILKEGSKKFLANPLGQPLNFVVNFKQNQLTVSRVDLENEQYSYNFPKEMEIIDVDYFPALDGTFGVIVAINDELEIWGEQHFVMGLSPKVDGNDLDSNLFPSWSLAIPERITVIRTLFTNEDMATKENSFKLFSKLNEWSNIVAIGAKQSNCYISHLIAQENNSSEDLNPVINKPSKNLVNIMAPYTQKNKNCFIYTVGECSKKYIASAISVTSLALLPRSRTLLVGLSTGGIITASLNPSNKMNQLDLRHERPIRYLIPLEPEDDPEKYEYFIAAADGSPRHPIMIHLWRGGYKDKNDDEEKNGIDGPEYYLVMEHRIQYGLRWICAKTLTHSRFLENGVSTNHRSKKMNEDNLTISPNQSSILNTSQSFGSAWNRSLVLLAYEKLNETGNENFIEAGIFDIDSYYYKRMPSSVTSDRTVLAQCAFLSTIRSNVAAADVEDINILTEMASDIKRYKSTISDADQLFYPSSLNFDRVFIGTSSRTEEMHILSLQNNILENVASNLEEILKDPSETASILLAAGIVSNNLILSSSPNSSINSSLMVPNNCQLSSDERVVLSAMLYNDRMEELTNLANSIEMNIKKKEEIANWIFYESCDFRKTICERTMNLFNGSSIGPFPEVDNVLSTGIRLFFNVQQLLKQFAKFFDDNSKIHRQANALNCSYIHTRLTQIFIYHGIVPSNIKIERKMREMHERRVVAASKNRVGLPVQITTRRLHVLAPEGEFWNGISHDQWYPPSPGNILEPILNVKVPERTKRELIIQYVIDWIRANSFSKLNDMEIAKDAQQKISDKLLGTNEERILFILEQEAKAVEDHSTVRVFDNQKESSSLKSTCENFWASDGNSNENLTEAEKEKFEKRYRLKKENPLIKLPELSEEEEKLYQVFLYNHQKYGELSSDFVKSNKILNALVPHVVNAKKKVNEKTDKDKEIENAVRSMFQRSKALRTASNSFSQSTSVFKTLSSTHNDSVTRNDESLRTGKKRKSMICTENDSPVICAPPTAKRISRKPLTPDSETASFAEDHQEHDDEINEAIQTPAKYLKKPLCLEDEMSPTCRVPQFMACPNSILKTAKTVQSPSRGRIRFQDNFQEQFKDAAPKLNFDILDEEADEEEQKKNENATIRTSENENDKNETTFEEEKDVEMEDDFEEFFETEKSFEIQENEENNEVCSDVVQIYIGNSADIEQSQCKETLGAPSSELNDKILEQIEKENGEEKDAENIENNQINHEKKKNAEKLNEEIDREEVEFEKSFEQAEDEIIINPINVENEDNLRISPNLEKQLDYIKNKEDEETEDEIEKEEEENAEKKDEEEFKQAQKQEKESESANQEEEKEISEQVKQKEEQEAEEKDLIERSFEIQNDEDVDPIDTLHMDMKKTKHEEILSVCSDEVPISNITNVQVTKNTSENTALDNKNEETTNNQKTPRKTRSRTTSKTEKCPSPVNADNEETQNTGIAKKVRQTPKRGSSVIETSQHETDTLSARRSARLRSKSESVQPEELNVTLKTPSKKQKTTDLEATTSAKKKRSVTRNVKTVIEEVEEEEEVSTPKRGRPRKNSEAIEEQQKTPSKAARNVDKPESSSKRARSTSRSSQPKTLDTPSEVKEAPKTPKSVRKTKALETIIETKGENSAKKTRATSLQPISLPPKKEKSNWRERVAKNLESVGSLSGAEIVRNSKPRASSVGARKRKSSESTEVKRFSKLEVVGEGDEEDIQDPPTPRRSARRLPRK